MTILALLLLINAAAGQVPTIDYTECGFPFTYKGKVYYSCIQNITGVTDINNQYGCFQVNEVNQVNRSGAICTGQPEGYSCPVGPDTLTVGSNSYPTTNVCGWYVIMQRYNISSFNWTQNWNTYKNGFASPSGTDFWLGLEPMHQITSNGNYRLRVEVQRNDGTKLGLGWYSGEYWQFSIGDETTDSYAISVSGLSSDGQVVDGFNPTGIYANATQNGQKFSTYDHDNDVYNGPNWGGSCSVYAGGAGWWFGNSSSWCWYNLLTNNWLGNNIWPFTSKPTPYRFPIYSVRLMIKPQ